jgi:hypothetical protein
LTVIPSHHIERLNGLAYRTIGGAYRAPYGIVILQRTKTALAIAACETAPARAACSALHRVRPL